MAFSDPNGIRQQNGWNESWQRDGRCHVLFHKQLELDQRATEGWTEEYDEEQPDGTLVLKKRRHAGAGRPIYVEKDYVRFFIPGDQHNQPDREATEADKAEYSQEWAAYIAGTDQARIGTPLEHWSEKQGGITRAQAEELKHFKVYTVEDLAACPDINGQKFQGFAQMKQRAKAFLEKAEKAAPLADLKAELEQERKKAADEKAALLDRLAALEEALKKQVGNGGNQQRR